MKNKKVKLSLNRKTIANLNKINQASIKGGVGPTISMECCGPTQLNDPDCGIPTINDSCFSWCEGVCNDF